MGGFFEMGNEYLFSIIIPVYNEEKFINRCIESIVSEGNANYEVVIIDDGSIDKTAYYCSKWVNRDNRIKYYGQNNSGVSVARNYGIEKSQGEYIMFLDGDDYLIQGWWYIVSDFFSNHMKRNTDVVIFDYDRLINNNQKRVCVLNFPADKISKREVVTAYLFSDLLNSACCKLYRRKFVVSNKICFPIDMKFGEDAVFMGKVINKSDGFVYIPSSIMVYEDNLDSAIHILPRTLEELIKLFEMKNSIFQQNKNMYCLNYNRFYSLQLTRFFSLLKSNVQNKKSFIKLCKKSSTNTYIGKLMQFTQNIKISNFRCQLQYYLFNNQCYHLLYIELLIEKSIINIIKNIIKLK